ncbi:AzlC family ABC transporter permease [Pseudomonas sp. 10B1]|uniref:AzlC family ABC transporter permease n=1 Tax=unclassified Pseudomonas TaxID=196821 RepID=UPI002AB42C64|nr:MULTISPECIES: AzlC family ABC transporter permease [unclassified Pseudomonas]MDY7562777.1 AzlC family ABC transporter permease [Pseudomonas sp. AB6]MEA9977359.1 AzlC family ABC transporter permease [Pseudomonas sp. RTS4]MEA9994424.1 AzlC family ABC transporter permease [Pseudomonas sp. AA4]MEB0087842.1 AzlC family ABC transporter permease [Pseudomonas sp. RTI1]MEB0126678.1 AzlC family ABC transporter permease [Pseudomonas sp. CCC1.2]
MSRYQLFSRGLRDSAPMLVGIAPFGIIFGTLAGAGGLSLWQAVGMSLFVYAGSAQFIVVSLMGAGASAVVILLTTFIVNLRHVLYSATLQPQVNELPQRWRVVLAFWLTDETFAVVQRYYLVHGRSTLAHWYWLGVASALYTCWVGSSLVGVLFGEAVPNMASWGLEFAMLATFIGIVVPLLRNRPQVAAALAAGAVALITHAWPYKLGLMAAASCGIAVGVLLERRCTEQADTSSNEVHS